MNKVEITYSNGKTREIGYYYEGVAKMVAQDFIRMRYSGVTHVKCTDGGRVVIDQPVN